MKEDGKEMGRPRPAAGEHPQQRTGQKSSSTVSLLFYMDESEWDQSDR